MGNETREGVLQKLRLRWEAVGSMNKDQNAQRNRAVTAILHGAAGFVQRSQSPALCQLVVPFPKSMREVPRRSEGRGDVRDVMFGQPVNRSETAVRQ